MVLGNPYERVFCSPKGVTTHRLRTMVKGGQDAGKERPELSRAHVGMWQAQAMCKLRREACCLLDRHLLTSTALESP